MGLEKPNFIPNSTQFTPLKQLCVKNCGGFEDFQAHDLLCLRFAEIDIKHETLGSEKKNFVIHDAADSTSITLV